MNLGPIYIVGAGRVGTALALLVKKSSLPVFADMNPSSIVGSGELRPEMA